MPIFESVSDIESLDFDYVIVGGGTAGLVVANRLTEDANVTVLVLEAGANNAGVQAIDVPLLASTLNNTQYNWNYSTAPQKGMDGRSPLYPRGKVLGGSSSTNYSTYNTGSRDDWDRYAKIAGDDRWSWEGIQPILRKIENFKTPADGSNSSVRADMDAHSKEGAVSITTPSFKASVDDLVMQTINDNPEEWPFSKDCNTGNAIGVGWTQNMIGDGKRAGSAAAYLHHGAVDRPNLIVLVHAYVTKLIKTGEKDGVPVFGAVEFASNAKPAVGSTSVGETSLVPDIDTPRHIANARKEIVLSSGAVNTPQIMMLSGIGDPVKLRELGIEPLVDLPDVGENLSDHPAVLNIYKSPHATEAHHTWLKADNIEQYVKEWEEEGTGPLTSAFGNHMALVRLPEGDEQMEKYGDPSAGPTSPHFELLFVDGASLAVPSPVPLFAVVVFVSSPHARGAISIRSADPFEPPVIDPDFFGHPFDMYVATQALRAAQRFLSGDHWKALDLSPIGKQDCDKGEDLQAHVSAYGGCAWHAVGTASLSAANMKSGVVGPDLRVKDTIGLRVADASVLPVVPSGHPTGPILVVGELAAEFIKSGSS